MTRLAAPPQNCVARSRDRGRDAAAERNPMANGAIGGYGSGSFQRDLTRRGAWKSCLPERTLNSAIKVFERSSNCS